MTWTQFNTAVRQFLLGYSTMSGVQDYVDRQIIAGAVDLQRAVEFYQTGHEDTLTEVDVVLEGSASRAPMPSGRIEAAWLRYNDASSATATSFVLTGGYSPGSPAELSDGIYTYSTAQSRYEKSGARFWVNYSGGRWQLWSVAAGNATYYSAAVPSTTPPWAAGIYLGGISTAGGPMLTPIAPDIRTELGLSQVGGDEFRSMRGGDTDRKGRLYLDAPRGIVYVTPALNPETMLVLRWTGVKTSFSGSDEVTFDAEAAHAVSEFVLSRLSRSIDKDLRQSQAYEAAYAILKRKLQSDFNARSFVEVNSRTVGYKPYNPLVNPI